MATPPLPDNVLREAMDALEKIGNKEGAARYLGIPGGTFSNRIQRAKERGIGSTRQQLETKQGNNPEHDLNHIVPAPLILRGTSTLYDENGTAKLQWVKTKLDDQKVEEVLKAAIDVYSQSINGLSPIQKPPIKVMSDILAVYPFGDPHFGMYSWAAETGDDFDIGLAKKLTLSAVDRLVSTAPPSETAIILPLGDVFHTDDQTNTTPQHHHQLDADSRYPKILMVGIETFRHAILRALQKHKKVIVRFVRGNHDPHAIWALATTTAAYFSNEPRVFVDLSPSWFWYFRFGKVLIGSTHGDTAKPAQLPGIMATDKAKDWGETKHRYWYTGHIHSKNVKEFPGVIWESFRTLAAKDAYSAGYGYRAGRDMECIIHHKDHGEIERHRCDIGMIG